MGDIDNRDLVSSTSARVKLGIMYLNGQGTPTPNIQHAKHLFEQAASAAALAPQSSGEAYTQLGLLSTLEKCGQPDLHEAKRHFESAVQLNDLEAHVQLGKLLLEASEDVIPHDYRRALKLFAAAHAR